MNPPRFLAWCEVVGGTFDFSGSSYPLSKGNLPLESKETNRVDWLHSRKLTWPITLTCYLFCDVLNDKEMLLNNKDAAATEVS